MLESGLFNKEIRLLENRLYHGKKGAGKIMPAPFRLEV